MPPPRRSRSRRQPWSRRAHPEGCRIRRPGVLRRRRSLRRVSASQRREPSWGRTKGSRLQWFLASAISPRGQRWSPSRETPELRSARSRRQRGPPSMEPHWDRRSVDEWPPAHGHPRVRAHRRRRRVSLQPSRLRRWSRSGKRGPVREHPRARAWLRRGPASLASPGVRRCSLLVEKEQAPARWIAEADVPQQRRRVSAEPSSVLRRTPSPGRRSAPSRAPTRGRPLRQRGRGSTQPASVQRSPQPTLEPQPAHGRREDPMPHRAPLREGRSPPPRSAPALCRPTSDPRGPGSAAGRARHRAARWLGGSETPAPRRRRSAARGAAPSHRGRSPPWDVRMRGGPRGPPGRRGRPRAAPRGAEGAGCAAPRQVPRGSPWGRRGVRSPARGRSRGSPRRRRRARGGSCRGIPPGASDAAGPPPPLLESALHRERGDLQGRET